MDKIHGFNNKVEMELSRGQRLTERKKAAFPLSSFDGFFTGIEAKKAHLCTSAEEYNDFLKLHPDSDKALYMHVRKLFIDVATLEKLKKVDKTEANKSEPVEEITEY